jgi:ParB family chromosome partitioning protein
MTTSKNKYLIIPLSKIRRPDVLDRIGISEEALNELADNIKEHGLLQSPLVRQAGEEYEIIFGDRRILAVTKLGWTEAECKIVSMDDTETAEVRASENLAREDLTVIEEARIYRNLVKKHGRTIDQIARRMGKSGGTVKRRLDLLKMPQSLQDAMHAKKISYGVAEALWPIADPSSLDYYLSFACDHGVTVTVARGWTADWKAAQLRLEPNQDAMTQLETPAAIRPTYIACDLCQQPELIQNLVITRLCTDCAKQISRLKAEADG